MTRAGKRRFGLPRPETPISPKAEQAIAELRRHVALVAAATSENDEPRIDQSAESVRLAFIALSDAEFEYSSTLAPFSALETMTTRTPTWRT